MLDILGPALRDAPRSLRVLCGREKKCIAGFQPAKVVLTQKELSRLRCRRDAGATFFLTTAESAEKENEKERYNYSPAVRECEKIV